MIQSIDTIRPRTIQVDGAPRQFLLRALARDLSLPQDHFAVTALSAVALKRQTLVVEGEPVTDVPDELADVSLDTWCRVVAQAAARNATA